MNPRSFLEIRLVLIAAVLSTTAFSCAPHGRGSPGGGSDVTARRNALIVSEGVGAGSLSTTALWSNGVWANGIWGNGLWTGGAWTDGVWQNGIWQNGAWTNGLFANGLWANGLWAQAIWAGNLSGDAGTPGNTLRNGAAARRLLQQIYACAMPPTIRDTTLDPNDGALLCAVGAGGATFCPDGYTCSAQNTCVVPLTGAIGVGVNTDGSTWWDSGVCDESCQRWVTACVLARTNAHGAPMEMSMRAPAVAPPGREAQFSKIQDALGTTPPEPGAYVLREGAYYGNLFGTTPSDTPPSGTGPASGPIAQSPVFFACAGPASNFAEMTKRFGSSVGEPGVVQIPGVCQTTGSEQGRCDGVDAAGSYFGCSTGSFFDPHYDEVITVYLNRPFSSCGNSVCEAKEANVNEPDLYCPSDCHPGAWAKDLPFIGDVSTGQFTQNVVSPNGRYRFPAGTPQVRGMTAVAADGSIFVVGNAKGAVDLGGGSLAGSGGAGVVAKFDSSGTHLWSVRFGDVFNSAVASFTYQVLGAAVSPTTGNVSVLGQNAFGQQLFVTTFNGATGAQIGTSTQIATNVDNYGAFVPEGMRSFTADHGGNLVIGMYAANGNFTIGGTALTCPLGGPTAAPCIAVAKFSPQTATSAQATLQWVSKMPWVGWPDAPSQSPYLMFNIALAVTTSNDIVVSGGPNLQKMCSTGAFTPGAQCAGAPQAWLKTPVPAQYALAVDNNGNIFGAGPGDGVSAVTKFDSNGNQLWTKKPGYQPGIQLPPPDEFFAYVWGLDGLDVGVDQAGNVIAASFGLADPEGGMDFGLTGAGLPTGVLPTHVDSHVFLASYDPSGGLNWVKQIPFTGKSLLLGMNIGGPNGRVILGGNYTRWMQSDGGFLATSAPSSTTVIDSFLTSFPIPSATDTTPPVIDAPAPLYVPATSAAGAPVFFMLPAARDAGNAGVTVGCDHRPGSTFIIGTTPVTCKATDPRGNNATTTFSVTVADTRAPLISPISSIGPIPAASSAGAPVTFNVITANDQIDGVVPVTCAPASGDTFPVGTTTVTCAARDNSNNEARATFQVTVAGVTLAPGASCTSDLQCSTSFCVDNHCCLSACGRTDSGRCLTCAASTDGTCTRTSNTQCRNSGGSVCDLGGFCDGTSDTCPAANTPALATTPCYTRQSFCASVEETLSCGGALTCPAPTSWDSCGSSASNAATLLGGIFRGTPPDGGALPSGGVEVTFTPSWNGTIAARRVKSGCPDKPGFDLLPENDSTGQGYYWEIKAEPPITCAAGQMNCVNMQVCVQYDEQWIIDAGWGDPSTIEGSLQLLHGIAPAGGGDGCDPTGNGWMPDTTIPVDTVNNIVCVPANTLSPFGLFIPKPGSMPTLHVPASVVAEATGPGGAVVTYTATATDVPDGPLTPSCLPASGTKFPLGTTTVNCTVVDHDGLSAKASFPVTVQDTKGPVFSNVPAPIVAYATGTAGVKVTYTPPTAVDAVDGPSAVTCTPKSATVFAPGHKTVTCNASDKHGHAAPPVTFDVWVKYQAPGDGTFFLQPINPDGSSIFKRGSTIPVKFKLTGASAGIKNLVARLSVAKISNGITGTFVEAVSNASCDGGNTFRYDASAGQYIDNLATKNLTAGTWLLRVDLGDGVDHSIKVSLK